MVNLTKENFNSNKKCISVSSARLDGSAEGVMGTAAGSDITLFNLPEKSLVRSVTLISELSTNGNIIVKIGGKRVSGEAGGMKPAPNSATPIVPKVFNFEGADAPATANAVAGVVSDEIDTGSGAAVTVTPIGTSLTAGVFYVIVEYIEYTRKCSELTPYTD